MTRWPPADLGQSATVVPVTVVAQAPTLIAATSIQGDHPQDFQVRDDGCTGQRLAAGASCEVWVRFVPTSAGSRSGLLRVTNDDGSHEATALQGFAYGGHTQVSLVSDPGDWVGGGSQYSYEPASARITASGNRQHVGFRVDGADGSWWYGDFAAAGGDLLAPGRYEATRYPLNGSGPGVDVGGNGRACNTITGHFTVTEAAFLADGSVKRFGATFEQHCDGDPPALRGSFEFRVGDTSSPAPWMTTGPLTPLPFEDGSDGGGNPGGGSGNPGDGTENVALLVRCRSVRPCRGTLVLRLLPRRHRALVLGRVKFSVPARGRRRVRVGLNASARRLRARWPSARLAAVIQSAPGGGRATVTVQSTG